ncbi:MAG: hypothetical protein Q8P68_00340 [Candidatus Peregrinibacteria bacterium]|nr:hypothetical protein [Candidatus Peregrinibacteria bacterium]MDZ4244930.1 hypothetical protein [Candidatus Gracilibacteria bacterium]
MKSTETKSQDKQKKTKLNYNNILIVILAIVLFANLVAMLFFTSTVGGKLDEAIDLTKPEEGTLTLITPEDCPQCVTLDPQKKGILAQNVDFEEKSINASQADGKAMISKYNITHLPSLVLETDEKIKLPLMSVLKTGAREIDESTLVWEQAQAPYFDLQDSITKGLVDIIFLTDSSCATCYDVKVVQKSILKGFGMYINSEKTFDISEADGRELLEKYSITNVPTIVLSEQASSYQSLNKVWNQIGDIDKDGSFVVRKLNVLNVIYHDLETGKIMQATKK